jgi:transcription elongation factor Elf1
MIETFSADSDQPFTCPYDGARTEYVDAVDNECIEACPHCGQIFKFEFDKE